MACGLPHLTRRSEFVRISRSGRAVSTSGMVVQVRRRGRRSSGPPAETHPNDGQGMRLGITASKKVGKAVVRNRARRRLRAVGRAVLPQHGAPGFDYVLIARGSTPSRAFSLLVSDLIEALGRLGLDRAARAAHGSDRSEAGGFG